MHFVLSACYRGVNIADSLLHTGQEGKELFIHLCSASIIKKSPLKKWLGSCRFITVADACLGDLRNKGRWKCHSKWFSHMESDAIKMLLCVSFVVVVFKGGKETIFSHMESDAI